MQRSATKYFATRFLTSDITYIGMFSGTYSSGCVLARLIVLQKAVAGAVFPHVGASDRVSDAQEEVCNKYQGLRIGLMYRYHVPITRYLKQANL